MPPKKEESVDLQTTVKTLVAKICASQDFIDQLSISLSSVIKDHFENRITQLEEDNKKMQTQFTEYEKTVQTLSEKCEKMEQSLKSKAIRVYGVRESRGEKIEKVVLDTLNKKGDRNAVKEKLHIIEGWEIESCFRIGKIQKDNSRPILVNFVRQGVKNQVYINKKMYKGTGIVIREDLTNGRVKLLKSVLQKVGDAGKVWTNYGRVFAKLNGNEDIHLIGTSDDINNLNV